mgnify:CR=1 FL=1
MEISEHIDNFITPARHKVGEYTIELDKLKDQGSYHDDLIKEILDKRLELYMFLDVIAPNIQISDGINFLDFTSWSEKELFEEIQYLRWRNDLDTFPVIHTNARKPIVKDGGISTSSTDTSPTIPDGLFNQILIFNSLGSLQSFYFEQYGGMLSDDIGTYFNASAPHAPRTKYMMNPTYTAIQWFDENPQLPKGVIGIEYDTGQIKIGPGYWNSLEYFSPGIYTSTEIPTNPIGDAKDQNLYGTSYDEMLQKFLNPYQIPEITNLKNQLQ